MRAAVIAIVGLTLIIVAAYVRWPPSRYRGRHTRYAVQLRTLRTFTFAKRLLDDAVRHQSPFLGAYKAQLDAAGVAHHKANTYRFVPWQERTTFEDRALDAAAAQLLTESGSEYFATDEAHGGPNWRGIDPALRERLDSTFRTVDQVRKGQPEAAWQVAGFGTVTWKEPPPFNFKATTATFNTPSQDLVDTMLGFDPASDNSGYATLTRARYDFAEAEAEAAITSHDPDRMLAASFALNKASTALIDLNKPRHARPRREPDEWSDDDLARIIANRPERTRR